MTYHVEGRYSVKNIYETYLLKKIQEENLGTAQDVLSIFKSICIKECKLTNESDYAIRRKILQESVSRKDHWKICTLFNKRLSEEILKGKHVRFPFKLGIIRIKKTKQSTKRLRYDYGYYRKTGQKLVHLNEHSDGFTSKWYWNKRNVSIKGVLAYSFVPVRTNKRALAKVMKEKNGHKRFTM
jgi:hypothetical protein